MKPEPEPESKPQPDRLGDGPPLNLPSPEQLEQFYALRGALRNNPEERPPRV